MEVHAVNILCDIRLGSALLFVTFFLRSAQKASFKSMITEVGDTFLLNAAAVLIGMSILYVILCAKLPKGDRKDEKCSC